MTLIYLSSAWVAGIFTGSIFNLPFVLVLIGLLPLPLLIFFRRYKKVIIVSSLSLIAFFGGASYYQASLPIDTGSLQSSVNQTVEIKGMVARDPVIADKTTRIQLSDIEIYTHGAWQKASGDVLLFVSRYPAYQYGDVIRVNGKLEEPPQLDGFDYKGYLANQGIYSIIRYPEIQLLESGKGSRPLAWIYSVRNRMSESLARVLPEPQAALAQGIILGQRSNIPGPVNDDFTRTGTTHILAISGQNLSILAGILLSFGIAVFGRRHFIYIWLALGTIWLYSVLTGMQPPVLRATYMASMFLAAELFGRQRSGAIGLFFAAAVMVGVTPRVIWDASFQMSFMAMAGLIFIYPLIVVPGKNLINNKLGEDGAAVSAANFVNESLSVTLGAIIAVWPIIAHYFGIISPVGPIATFFALPVLPFIIIFGIITGGLGIVLLPFAQVIGWVTWLLISYLMLVVKIFAAVPAIEGARLDPKFILVYYLLLGAALWLINYRKLLSGPIDKAAEFISGSSRKYVIPSLAVVAILVSLTAAMMPDNRLHVSFLDVGQGDAILIQKGGRQILVDGGPSPQAIILELGKEMPFWDRTIDLVVLTHPEADHLNGLVEVLRRYEVKQVLYANLNYTSSTYNEWLKLIEDKNIIRTYVQTGEKISFGKNITLEILNPPASLSGEADANDNSIVLHLTDGKFSFLLTGDISSQKELDMITSRADLPSTVLKVAHHGSKYSTSAEFLAVVAPRLAVISDGRDNSYGFPTRETLGRLAKSVGAENIFRTDLDGTIDLITDGERLWLRR